MVIKCAREGCNHNKSLHEYTRDGGVHSGACTVRGCPCGYELFGFKKPKVRENI